ncbi:DUF4091 domain-containing protein [Olivibacter sp. SDN3]|uniref:DUF4091 domain-containing protein n=1 Tax=Olivibacter sp. SDN3 TaxID=2764720 RepID=UPI00165180E3|nr:DUF4091 domain-containing protein [Olivibacter sp. SDN3]QNL51243.1 DUF4091 domain-containing protein [Olivibacter sp. SDN3]
MSRLILLAVFLVNGFLCNAQLPEYKEAVELVDPYPEDNSVWSDVGGGINSSFVSVDESFKRSAPPQKEQLTNEWKIKAWKGEKVHTQALVWAKEDLHDITLQVSDLVAENGNKIAADAAKAKFIRYVLTDHLGELESGCGIPQGLDTSLVADLIDDVASLSIENHTSRPIWLSVEVPESSKAGVYRGALTISSADQETQTLPFEVEVLAHTLPKPSEWSYHLDLWQNPYAVARVYGIEPWSEEHFEAMRPYMQLLADAGQKVITASIIYDPWNGQTYDIYESMIQWVKKEDGSWFYDYSAFDRWVEYMMSFGVDKFIECYSMIPWDLQFYYFDEASGEQVFLKAKPGENSYKEHWKPMLVDFAKHLKEKGWFEKTTIAMDEREMKDMQRAIAIIKEADPQFNISLAGGDHPELYNELIDYCVALRYELSKDLIQERRDKGYTTTFYTCCTEPYPNTFTSSSSAEATWLAWYALNKDFDGYLRWAYNCWGPKPLQDTRVGTWSAGDAWLVYPGARSSIRFERLIEGIQDFEKAKILRASFEKQGKNDELKKLNEAITPFEFKALDHMPASQVVNQAKEVLNSF